MLDANLILLLMGASAIAGFITKLLSDSIGKLLAILGVFPFIFFIISAVNSGMGLDNTAELSSWITMFVNNMVPMILAYAAEGAGVSVCVKLKNRF